MDALTSPTVPPTVRVLLVDDHEVVRLGLRSVLGGTPGLSVVGEAATAAAAVREVERLTPDVVVLDVRLPDGSGIDACREICTRRPDTRVLMLTSYPNDEALFAAIMAGAAGYLLKAARGDELVRAVRTLGAGASLLDPALTGKVLAWLRRPEHRPSAGRSATGGPLVDLGAREQRILELVAQGKTNREIGRAMYLSDKTVKHYISGLLRKLHVARRSEAAALWAGAPRKAPPGP